MKKYDIGLPVVFIILAALIIYNSSQMGGPVSGTAMGSGVWPTILAVALIILSVILIVRALFQKKSGDKPIDFKSKGMIRVYITVGILAVFILLLKLFGFYVAGVFVIPALMLLLGERRPWLIAAVTVGMMAFVVVVFVLVLKVKLPTGIVF